MVGFGGFFVEFGDASMNFWIELFETGIFNFFPDTIHTKTTRDGGVQ